MKDAITGAHGPFKADTDDDYRHLRQNLYPRRQQPLVVELEVSSKVIQRLSKKIQILVGRR